jgi:D-beta-D-heptose 7-phosphate kinase/D-beta-D-heptose 1-phosphate adenosyltransferase
MKKVVLVTGGFDPIHSGHVQYFKRAKELGDILYVGVNSDEWLTRKKGRPFMPLEERLRIIQELRMVDYTLKFDDKDGSARNAIKLVTEIHPNDTIIFANGGDRTKDNIPEMSLLNDTKYSNLKFEFGVGGTDKMNSSSWILEEWKAPKTERPWGYYRVLHEPSNKCKVKELTVMPNKHLSMQRHKLRNEVWFVAEGIATVHTVDPHTTDYEVIGDYIQNQTIHIGEQMWHQLRNDTGTPLKIIEIQYGDGCYEEDIERREV